MNSDTEKDLNSLNILDLASLKKGFDYRFFINITECKASGF